MSTNIDPLKKTTQGLHRIQVEVVDESAWYSVMREARAQFGKNWKTQPKFKRKLDRNIWLKQPLWCWFEVPDTAFATWISVKLSLRTKLESNK